MKDLNFCQKATAFPSRNKNKKTELYYIFATDFQINLFDSVDFLFIDATFKTSPKGFYQTLNIICYCEEAKSTNPIFHISMTSKNKELYNSVFKEIINLLEMNKLDINFKDKYIMCDFEKALRESIKINFKGIK